MGFWHLFQQRGWVTMALSAWAPEKRDATAQPGQAVSASMHAAGRLSWTRAGAEMPDSGGILTLE